MGKKDIGLKNYFRDPVRYADLWNGSVFRGKQIIKPEGLQEITPVSLKSDREAVLERTGDLVMMQNCDGHRFAVLALENQERVDYSMPARVMIREALEYDGQIKEICRRNSRGYKRNFRAAGKDNSDLVYSDSGEYLYRFRRGDCLLPVITLVVYWGEQKWQGARSLHEMMDFEDTLSGLEIKKLIPEYPLHFLDLSDFNHFEYFRTELRPLLELFQRRNSKEEFAGYIRENEKKWNMDDESWYILGQMIDSKKIRELIQKGKQRKEEDARMCKALDDLVEDGKAVGKAEFIVDLLEEYGAVPDCLKETILKQTDIAVLKSWHKLAAHVGSIEEFSQRSNLSV